MGRGFRYRIAYLLSMLVLGSAPSAWAGDFDLDDDDDDDKSAESAPRTTGKPTASPKIVVRSHRYTLEECLALADRNHPNLWAARARLAFVHAQLDEAKWTPFWQWYSTAFFGVLPPITGTPFYTASTASSLNPGFASGWSPFLRFEISGAIPLYTFGKIDSARRAAEANVRLNEWDLEKFRQQLRMDVRRAYFGVMLARDARYILQDVISRLDKAISGLSDRLRKGDTSVEEIDRLRLKVYKDEVLSRGGEPDRGESWGLSALRFLTGVHSGFDLPDEPLKRPDRPLGAEVQYLSAARLFRPEVNMARAGVEARKAQVELARARYFPDIGIALSSFYNTAPSAVIQNNAWIIDPFNRFGFGAAFGARWSLDLLPASARVSQAESQLEEARALSRLALGGIASEVERAYATALEARVREETWARAEHRAKQWISTVRDAIDLGTKDERALIEPLRVYVNARVNHAYALMDLNVAMSDLARVSGWDSAAPTGS